MKRVGTTLNLSGIAISVSSVRRSRAPYIYGLFFGVRLKNPRFLVYAAAIRAEHASTLKRPRALQHMTIMPLPPWHRIHETHARDE